MKARRDNTALQVRPLSKFDFHNNFASVLTIHIYKTNMYMTRSTDYHNGTNWSLGCAVAIVKTKKGSAPISVKRCDTSSIWETYCDYSIDLQYDDNVLGKMRSYERRQFGIFLRLVVQGRPEVLISYFARWRPVLVRILSAVHCQSLSINFFRQDLLKDSDY